MRLRMGQCGDDGKDHGAKMDTADSTTMVKERMP